MISVGGSLFLGGALGLSAFFVTLGTASTVVLVDAFFLAGAFSLGVLVGAAAFLVSLGADALFLGALAAFLSFS